ncbi:hypothetical protein OG948_59430 (plasmid) [Embleya sp. NBC_00888]|uniref:hypothetical protein n=1 Tax=Embleya sp. NBC_00888 TaxID=2975960 RepID=UPI002F917D00|nr:hypothetical protein OG948_00005 [Embleya sp. NBC_00888]WSY43334.1 hypothetical protein OG948_34060 [Embleya sp. NBC_00888]WSY43714.1 hypothetical protein OG948_34065 [Embleya sp. NBC_00888]WSY48134.1 hypothetical protein OG948_59430 [Embleya sp. NBC_00888]
MTNTPFLPPVTVVLDPFDDVTHTRAALHAHHPAQGRLTVHPTPAATSPLTLAYDVLAALGKPVPFAHPSGPRNQQIRNRIAWATAAAWILTTDITHLTLLRAHLLPPSCWQHLLTLRAHTGIRLQAVCHRPTVPTALTRALATVPHHLADAAALLPPTDPKPDIAASAVPRRPTNRWITLPALARLGERSRHEPPRPGCGCTPRSRRFPARTFARLRPPVVPRLRQATAAEILRRLDAATAHPRPAAAVVATVLTAASTAQLVWTRATDLSPDADALLLHDPSGYHYGCVEYPVPPWARRSLIAARHLTWITSGVSAFLFVDPSDPHGIAPELPALADRCRLRARAPQPPPSRRRGTR